MEGFVVMNTTFMTENALHNLCEGLEIYKHERSAPPSFLNFHYFSPKSVGIWGLYHTECQYVVAFEENKIIGILQLFPVKEENTFAVSFIDVHIKYRQKGVAKALYQCLNNHVKSDWIVYGTDLSTLGEECNLYKLRRRLLTNCVVYDDRDEYRYKHLGHKMDRSTLQRIMKREEKAC
jgi:hypothetical protein